MEALVPSPQTTLLILLGASEWPLYHEFQDSKAFANAAREVKAYFLDPKRFGVSPENILDAFNSDNSSDEQDAQIGQFLERRFAAMKATGHPSRDLLVYFVGHGGFVGRDSDFYLAIRRTRTENPRASGISMLSLADTLTEKARYLRRIIILDCCFAAAAFSAFQAGPAQVAIEKIKDAFEVKHRGAGFPAKGTTLLCSSSQKSPSLLLPDGSSTMFTKALLDALAEGLPPQRERLSLREVKDIAAGFLSETRNAPRPIAHSPDQSEGDIADIPFFPNPRVMEVRVRQEESKKRLLVEEAERTGRMEEDIQRRLAINTSQTHPTGQSSQPSDTMPQAHPSSSQPAKTSPIRWNKVDIDTKGMLPLSPSLNVPLERTLSRRSIHIGIGWAAGLVVMAGGIGLALFHVLSIASSAIGLLILLVGVAFCFFGYRFFRILIAIWGFFVGFELGAAGMTALFGQNFLGTTTGWVLGFVIGIVIALLAYFFYYFAIVILGASIGYSIGTGIMAAIGFNNPGFISVIVGVVVAVVLAFIILLFNLPKLLIMLFTAIGGAEAIISGILILFGQIHVANLQYGIAVADIRASWFWSIVWIALAVLGFVTQWSTMREYTMVWSESYPTQVQ